MKSIILFVAFTSIATCQVSQKPIPGWLHGTWQGNVGYEHDTTMFPVRIFIDSSKSQIRLISLSDGHLYRCSPDSTNRGLCRFKVRSSIGAKPSLFSISVFDLMQVPGSPDSLIHLQFYQPNEQLWLGELKKSN